MPPRPVTENDGTAAAVRPSQNEMGEAAALAATRNGTEPHVVSAADNCNATAANPAGTHTQTATGTANTKAPTDFYASAEPSDEALMQSLCSGQDSALAPLMQRWELPVKGFLLRLGVPAGDVEDIAQEAFVRLYLKRAAYRQGAPFKPWLLTLAANLGRNRLRWRLRRRESSIDALFEPSATAEGGTAPQPHVPDESAPLPSTIAEQNQRRRAVRKVIDALPAKLRSVAVCVDLEGLSHAEAAQVLGCTAKAVETRLRRARERIRTGCAAWIAEERL